ncbi:hypothetical protein EZV62_013018 [Acer yangbiense]|uniref:DUF7781 domain-containing protein n=1 Tax=Acer yangbiense TaxID=1000413 RepID=A0A5C7HXU0_9ROSI|nr:hypothetical protein EZV62_013018 [Acer yangbiense]
MDTGSNGEKPTSWEELYNINLMPSELFLKFRKELEGFRVGFNFELSKISELNVGALEYSSLYNGNTLLLSTLYNDPINDIHAKIVLKPLSPDRRWKFTYEPIRHDVHLISKKIPLTKFLNLQVGIGHNFQLHATGWKWKLTTCLGGDGISRIQNKTSVGLCPGLDFRFGWRADFVIPEVTGQISQLKALGTEEPLFNMNSGRLHASLDRVETIITHTS